MATMDGWDWVLLIGGGFLAITMLCQLMSVRRNRVIEELTAEAARQRRRDKPKKKNDANSTGRAA